jgi:hypothetical protein
MSRQKDAEEIEDDHQALAYCGIRNEMRALEASQPLLLPDARRRHFLMSEVDETRLRELWFMCQAGVWSESECWGAIEREALLSPRSGSLQKEQQAKGTLLSELAAWSKRKLPRRAEWDGGSRLL